jgi:hypothetical protein
MNFQRLLSGAAIGLGICLAGISGAHAQQISAVSPAVLMDFGYPELLLLDDVLLEEENPNNFLDAGEAVLISFTVENHGAYPARFVTVKPQEINRIQGLVLPVSVEVGDLKPGEKRVVQVGVEATASLQKGTASFIFYLQENGEPQNISIVYALATAQ